MASRTYIERALGSCRTFQLRGTELTVEKKVGQRIVADEFDLSRVGPCSARVKLMNVPALNRSLTYLGVTVVIALLARAVLSVPAVWIGIIALLLSLPALRVLLHFFRPVEIEQFKDSHGTVLFDFICSKKRSQEREEFIEAVRIAIAKKEPSQPPEPTPSGRGSS